jgi:geranylgeranyl transferase type-1 subunit beta
LIVQQSYEGGYGQEPYGEALGGTTYCALAALQLAEASGRAGSNATLTSKERRDTIRWLLSNQDASTGGFSGRTGKPADACYCFWCGAALEVGSPLENVGLKLMLCG